MNPWIPHLLRAGGGGGGPVLPPAGRTMLANLKSSLILDEGTGDPTWSRATKAWGFNELGYLTEIASGCAFFGGARLVRNLVPTPSNTLAVAGTKTVTLTQAATLQFSMGAGAGTATFSGTGGATGTLAAGASRVRVNKTVTAGTFIVTASVDALVDLSIVDVTGYDSSYIPEYVSVGVLPAPFHGAGIDGAKYFETDWQGAPIPAANLLGFKREPPATNNLLYSGNLSNSVWAKPSDVSALELVVNGVFADSSSWDNRSTGTGSLTISGGAATVVGTDSNNRGWVTQTKSTTVGKVYRVSCDYTAVSGTTFLVFGSATGTGVLAMSTTGAKFIDVVASATTMYIGAQTGGSGGNGVLDNISLKETAIQTTAITGLDGIANTATTLTASAADAIILQPTSGIASAARCASAYVKRRTGTGTISFTQDGGSSWTDITSQINSSTYSRVQITSTLANPSVGFKISTSGDAIDIDVVQNEAGSVATSPIVTTTTTVTRNADSLSYQTASNWSDTAGTAFVEVAPYVFSGTAVGFGTNGVTVSVTNSGVKGYDGTNTANGPAGSPSSMEKIAVSWSGTSMKAASSGSVGVSSSYDGSFGLTSITIGTNGYMGHSSNVAIYNYQMTDAELQGITA